MVLVPSPVRCACQRHDLYGRVGRSIVRGRAPDYHNAAAIRATHHRPTLLRRDGISSALTKGNSGYSVRSTTVALAAFFCTDSTPFLALAFDS